MNAYVDSSVLLRVLLGEKGRLKEWKAIDTGVASSLVEVECLRTLARLRLVAGLSDSEVAPRREAVYRPLEPMEIVEIDRTVLGRTS